MHIFDYSFLNYGMLPAFLVNTTAAIYELRSESVQRKQLYSASFLELEKIAKVQSVKGSNAIEGIISSDERIYEITANSSEPATHAEQEIAGYRDALNLIHESGSVIPFDETTIRRLHTLLFSHTAYAGSGEYKKNDNLILEIDKQGLRKVRFIPVSAADTAAAMQQLILAYSEAHNDPNINQLFLIPCVILDFLCIHPFSDGNGRISRLLTLLLLYQSGFDIGKYISFEEKINQNREIYYEDLRLSSEKWHENRNDYIPFIKNFIACLYECYRDLDERFTVVNGRKLTKAARVESLVCNALVPLSKADLCAQLPDVSQTTIETVLGKLVREGKIRKIGSAQQTKYIRQE